MGVWLRNWRTQFADMEGRAKTPYTDGEPNVRRRVDFPNRTRLLPAAKARSLVIALLSSEFRRL